MWHTKERDDWQVPIIVAAAIVVLLLGSATPLLAQQTWTWRHSHDDRKLSVSLRGEVELSADERSVLRLTPGGRLQVEQSLPGQPERMVIVTAPRAESGALEYVYLVSGRVRSWDDDGRSWLARLLPEIARESGMGVEGRVRRIYGSRGAAGVLQEIESIRSTSSRRAHLHALLALAPLSSGEAARALRIVGGISSSSERSRLLRALTDRLNLGDEGVRAVFFEAVDGISSSSEKRRVLVHVLQTNGSDAAIVRAAVRSARLISSDSEKAAVLLAVPTLQLRDSATIRTYRDTLDSIGSRSARERVMTHLIAAQG